MNDLLCLNIAKRTDWCRWPGRTQWRRARVSTGHPRNCAAGVQPGVPQRPSGPSDLRTGRGPLSIMLWFSLAFWTCNIKPVILQAKHSGTKVGFSVPFASAGGWAPGPSAKSPPSEHDRPSGDVRAAGEKEPAQVQKIWVALALFSPKSENRLAFFRVESLSCCISNCLLMNFLFLPSWQGHILPFLPFSSSFFFFCFPDAYFTLSPGDCNSSQHFS